VAVAAVQAALAVAQARTGAGTVRAKGVRDLVTDADVGAEDAIRDTLRRLRSDIPVVGEERGGIAPDHGPYWLVDPICGTSNFAANLPLYAVNVALVESGTVTLGVIGEGSTGEVFAAERGAGAWSVRDGQRLATSDAFETIALDPGKAGEGSLRYADAVHRVLRADRWQVRMLGTSLAFTFVAQGRLAGVANFDVDHPLHVAAGCLLAEEAGATVTDFQGAPWTLASRTFLAAATPALHAALLPLLAD
jgi:fructose-1,6-bisphosphatase/inositol monophosphatase family enzyme